MPSPLDHGEFMNRVGIHWVPFTIMILNFLSAASLFWVGTRFGYVLIASGLMMLQISFYWKKEKTTALDSYTEHDQSEDPYP
jgi:hypothetical protein